MEGKTYGVVYVLATGRYALTLNGERIMKRIRRFRQNSWRTFKGAQAAANALNAEQPQQCNECGNSLTGGQCFA